MNMKQLITKLLMLTAMCGTIISLREAAHRGVEAMRGIYEADMSCRRCPTAEAAGYQPAASIRLYNSKLTTLDFVNFHIKQTLISTI